MRKYLLFVMSIFIIGNEGFAQSNENVKTVSVGNFKISLLSEGQQRGKTDILIGATPEMLQKYVPDHTFPNAVNAFLVQMPDKNVLIDAGFGRNLFDNMLSLGVSPEKIDMILLTHMHGDHIGGLLQSEQIAFPNAELYLPQPEYDYWMSDDAMNRLPENRRGGFVQARKVISVYKSKLHLFEPIEPEMNESNLFPGFRGIAAYGHTPGHTGYLIESANEQLLVWGDLAHAMNIQMPCPDVAVTYDVDPMQAVSARKKLLRYISKNKIPVAGMHIAFPGMGKITESDEEGYIFSAF